MTESYVLILLTILILLIVIIGYFIQRKIRQLELESNTMKCDIESHSDYVSNILNKQNKLIYEIINEGDPNNMSVELKESLNNSVQTIDFSKINDILKEDKDTLTKQRNNISLPEYDNESSVDNDLQSDYDISSDMSDHESMSDSLSFVEEILSDNSLSDDETNNNDDETNNNNDETNNNDDETNNNDDETNNNDDETNNNNDETNNNNDETNNNDSTNNTGIRVIHSVNNIQSKIPTYSTTKSIKLNIQKVNNVQSKRLYTRKTPIQPANKFNTGFQMISENDNAEYKVIETKTGNKRWMICKK